MLLSNTKIKFKKNNTFVDITDDVISCDVNFSKVPSRSQWDRADVFVNETIESIQLKFEREDIEDLKNLGPDSKITLQFDDGSRIITGDFVVTSKINTKGVTTMSVTEDMSLDADGNPRKFKIEGKGELTPEALTEVLEGSETVVVDINEEGDKVQVRLDADVVGKVDRALLTPVTTPTSTELVGVGTDKSQLRVKIGSGLSYNTSTDTLSATGGGSGGDVYILTIDSLYTLTDGTGRKVPNITQIQAEEIIAQSQAGKQCVINLKYHTGSESSSNEKIVDSYYPCNVVGDFTWNVYGGIADQTSKIKIHYYFKDAAASEEFETDVIYQLTDTGSKKGAEYTIYATAALSGEVFTASVIWNADKGEWRWVTNKEPDWDGIKAFANTNGYFPNVIVDIAQSDTPILGQNHSVVECSVSGTYNDGIGGYYYSLTGAYQWGSQWKTISADESGTITISDLSKPKYAHYIQISRKVPATSTHYDTVYDYYISPVIQLTNDSSTPFTNPEDVIDALAQAQGVTTGEFNWYSFSGAYTEKIWDDGQLDHIYSNYLVLSFAPSCAGPAPWMQKQINANCVVSIDSSTGKATTDAKWIYDASTVEDYTYEVTDDVVAL